MIISILAIVSATAADAQTDTVAVDSNGHKIRKVDTSGRQVALGVDLFNPVLNHFIGSRSGFELTADYYTRNEFYLVLEGGDGKSNVNYNNLQYTTNNSFLRFGFNKSLLTRYSPNDWDIMFMGMRAAGSIINRSAASYTIADSVWGNVQGEFPNGKPFPAFWAELVGGMRVELAKKFFIGWTIRGKFLLNGKSFDSLSPLYIEGYGAGDKNAVFDFDIYVTYSLRWKRKTPIKDTGKTKPK